MCVNGMMIALELKKSSKEKPDKLQEYNIAKIIEARGIAIVVCPENWDEVSKILTMLAETPKTKEGEVKDGH